MPSSFDQRINVNLEVGNSSKTGMGHPTLGKNGNVIMWNVLTELILNECMKPLQSE